MANPSEQKSQSTPKAPLGEHRADLLLKMYDQMFNDINRHIMTVWQSVATLAGTAALLALVEKAVIPLDVPVTLIVLACGWLIANCYDSSYWYNRNLVIIANIERQFLTAKDLREIHYYFGEHRANMKMLTHLRIQQVLGLMVVALALIVHFVVRVAPGLSAGWATLEPLRAMPYGVAVLAIAMLLWLRADRRTSYANFLKNSPGLKISTRGIEYGTGHPTEN